MSTLLQHAVIIICLITSFIVWHAYIDSNKEMEKSEALYKPGHAGKQPRLLDKILGKLARVHQL